MNEATLHHLCDKEYLKICIFDKIIDYKERSGLAHEPGSHLKQKIHVHSHPFLLALFFSVFAADTQEYTHPHYQVNASTYHSSQLTPIYPRAFTTRAENRGSDIASL